MRQHYIVIEGAIGVGKTTLARMLQKPFQARLVLEVFEENPFLVKFYESRARYAFQTQIFFLLSRYRQQQEQIPHMRRRTHLISDYMFAKDWLFARLNLGGDEWEVYEQLHTALAKQIPVPDLIVYLQADTDVLMSRIAQRDRPYERDMDRAYIDTLRQTYDRYFSGQPDGSVLVIDTNDLNFVTNPDDLAFIEAQIQTRIQDKTSSPATVKDKPELRDSALLEYGQPLADLQRFHVELDRSKRFNVNVYFNYLCLSEEMGELGSELARLWTLEDSYIAQGYAQEQARQLALAAQQNRLESELADCLAYLLKLANYTGIEMESAYLEKMKLNQDRSWV